MRFHTFISNHRFEHILNIRNMPYTNIEARYFVLCYLSVFAFALSLQRYISFFKYFDKHHKQACENILAKGWGPITTRIMFADKKLAVSDTRYGSTGEKNIENIVSGDLYLIPLSQITGLKYYLGNSSFSKTKYAHDFVVLCFNEVIFRVS